MGDCITQLFIIYEY